MTSVSKADRLVASLVPPPKGGEFLGCVPPSHPESGVCRGGAWTSLQRPRSSVHFRVMDQARNADLIKNRSIACLLNTGNSPVYQK